MLIKLRFRFPEIIFGALLSVALFALGATFWSSQYSSQATKQPSAPAATDGGQQNKEEKRWWQDPIAIFTLALVFVGAAQVVLFYVQLKLIRQSLIDAKTAANAAKESADAAKEGSRAARDSADISKLAMVASDRAYVHFNGCRWISHRDNSDGHIFWRIRPTWINSGNTPTRQLRLYAHYDLRDDELPTDYAFIPDATVTPVPGMIAPKGVVESGPRDYRGTDLAEIGKGKKYFYIWGIARYRDVFPGTPERITKFCVQASNVSGDPTRYWDAKDNPIDFAFASYARHNCADEDCEE